MFCVEASGLMSSDSFLFASLAVRLFLSHLPFALTGVAFIGSELQVGFLPGADPSDFPSIEIVVQMRPLKLWESIRAAAELFLPGGRRRIIVIAQTVDRAPTFHRWNSR
jgi:hypothetical protein